MSTSLRHFLTIIGNGADKVEAACDELLARRVERDSKSYGSDDWSEAVHKDIESLCRALVAASRRLPVLYYAQYLDPWTVADSVFRLVKWPDGKRRHICGANFGLAYYPSKHSDHLLAQIEVLQGPNQRCAETGWYLNHLRDAIHAAEWLDDRFLVISISEVIDASRQDEEIRASLQASMALPTP